MAEDNWRELLDDPEVVRVVQQVVRGEGRRIYPNDRDRILYDDLESYLWEKCVEVARATELAPRSDDFYAFLYVGLRMHARYHRGNTLGPLGTPRRQAQDSLTSLTAMQDASVDGSYRSALAGANYLFSRTLSREDPLGRLLYLERLERLIRRARALSPGYTTQSDPSCREPLCTTPAKEAGYCGRHYQRHYALWGAQSGATPCAEPTCARNATARGWCDMHYRRQRRECAEHWRAERPTGCSEQGCSAPHKGHGYCRRHLRQAQKRGDL